MSESLLIALALGVAARSAMLPAGLSQSQLGPPADPRKCTEKFLWGLPETLGVLSTLEWSGHCHSSKGPVLLGWPGEFDWV